MKKQQKRKAVSYIRMSTKEQADSPDQQRKEIEKLADREGFKIVHEYLDHGISGGSTKGRTQFLQMFDDAEAGKFDAILCWDQSRFSREEPRAVFRYLDQLAGAGVKLITCHDGEISFENFGWVKMGVGGEQHRNFLIGLSKSVIRGQNGIANSGKNVTGKAPYGYVTDSETQRYVIDEDNAKTVRWIFDQCANHDGSSRGIASDLNARSVPSPSGKKWRRCTVAKLLKNPKYTGAQVWGRQRAGKWNHRDGEGSKNGAGNGLAPQDDWAIVPNAHPAIVSQETFDQAQRQLEARRTTKRRHKSDFLLTGLLVCAECGTKMASNSRTIKKNGKTYVYKKYVCGLYRNAGSSACSCNSISEAELMNAAVDVIRREYLHPDRLRDFENAMRAELTQTSELDPRIEQQIRKQLGSKKQEYENARLLLMKVDDDMLAEVQQGIRELRDQINNLESQLRALSEPLTHAAGNVDDQIKEATAALWGLSERLSNCTKAEIGNVLRGCVESIECTFTHAPLGKAGRIKSTFAGGVVNLSDFPPSAITL